MRNSSYVYFICHNFLPMRFLPVIIIICFASTFSAFGQPVIQVRGTYQPQEIKERAEFFARMLDLDSSTFIQILFSNHLPKHVDGFILFKDSREEFGTCQVTIKINNQAHRSHQYLTLAHEMVHARQFLSGDLKKLSAVHFLWEGEHHKHIDYIPFHGRKWEKQAIADAQTLMKQYNATVIQASAQ